MGLGLGSYVGSSSGSGGSSAAAGAAAMLGGASYLAFLAPGLLAAVAMQTGAGESTFPIMAGILWDRTFHAMLATPVTVRDVLIGKLLFIGLRLFLVTGVFFGIMAAFGAAAGPLSVLAVPGAVLTGFAFVTPIVAFSAVQKDSNGFNGLFRFGMIPMFLFSGTFFPISQLPAVLQPLAWVTPLWHGVDLCRSLTLATASPVGVAVHVTYLLAVAAAGFLIADVVLRRRLRR
jgi:lipooligosaccharide transport system permease protein